MQEVNYKKLHDRGEKIMYKGRCIIEQVTKAHCKSVNEVQTEMVKGIDAGYANRTKKWKELFGEEKPSPEAFIETLAMRLVK